MFPVQTCDLKFWWGCIYNKIKNILFRIGLCCLCGYSRRSCIYWFSGTSSNWSFVLRSFVLSYEQPMSLCSIVVICQSCCSFRCQWQHTLNCHCWRNFFVAIWPVELYLKILISLWCCVTNLLHVCLLAAVMMYGRLQLMQSTTGGDTMSPLLWWAVYVTTLMTEIYWRWTSNHSTWITEVSWVENVHLVGVK